MGLDTADGRRRDLSGWNIAAAFSLLAAAFLVERLAPAENEGVPERKTKRGASAIVLTGEGDRGRLAASPSEMPAKGWKDILLRVYSNIGDHRILANFPFRRFLYDLARLGCRRGFLRRPN